MTDEKGNKIPATAESADKTAVTPLLRVNLDGFWEISTNGGATYSLLGGKECTAIGKNGVSEDGVFKEVVYDSEKKILTVTLTDGQVYKIPCTESFYLRIPGTSKQQVFPLGEKRVYEVEQTKCPPSLSLHRMTGRQISKNSNLQLLLRQTHQSRKKRILKLYILPYKVIFV
ncbi:PL29 family lyase N-terminal domain-containing protein [Bacteroides sp. CR5/BHMF/2]|nr:PL29 family lyase N-terminal domain-containing protein [Bacteroides sp. CR5/BHMF/2]